jgi:transposase InsO family protein
MLKRSSHAKASRSEKKKNTPSPRDDRRVDHGGRAESESSSNLSSGKYLPTVIFPVEKQIQRSRSRSPEGNEARQEIKNRSEGGTSGARTSTGEVGVCGSECRTSAAEKKREFGLHGDLRGRHLSKSKRDALIAEIKAAVAKGESINAICKTLEINPRAYYRWISGEVQKENHGGGGGHNKITPLEEKRVVAFAKKHPNYRCRRIAYELERQAVVFIGKSRVAEILKKYGINHEFVRQPKKENLIPAEMLLHEPWRKNLLWGTDWTYLKIDGKFWFLLLIIDWYSRKILSFGLFPEITKFQVVAVITEAVAIERIEELGPDILRPRLVADHGSANAAKYTRTNIEVQGLDLWLSGVGRPTGNARTERVMGTLKREEIDLQEEYESEEEAKKRITAMIHDYNFYRPNQGNGGFAPNSVHHTGRHVLSQRRKDARQFTQDKRRKHWTQEVENGSQELI